MKILKVISLIIVALWWVHLLIWQPGLTQFVGGLVPTQVPAETAELARDRAFTYATHGTTQSADIFFSAAEKSHLNDVSRLYKPLSLITNFASIGAWSYLIIALARKESLRPSLLLAAKTLLAFPVIGVLFLLTFQYSFIWFHQIFFPQGNWAFPADSMLIRLFPEAFWMAMAGVIGALFAAISGVYYLLGRQSHAGQDL